MEPTFIFIHTQPVNINVLCSDVLFDGAGTGGIGVALDVRPYVCPSGRPSFCPAVCPRFVSGADGGISFILQTHISYEV